MVSVVFGIQISPRVLDTERIYRKMTVENFLESTFALAKDHSMT